MRIREYREIDYSSIELEADDAVPESVTEYVRISVPASAGRSLELIQSGYVLVDRTMEVKVPLLKNKTDFKKHCRMPVEISGGCREEVRKVAEGSFGGDCRFQVTFSSRREVLAGQILDAWLSEQKEIFQCRYKDAVAGFADVRPAEEHRGLPFIYLAAVEEKYRAAGAAMSLYASVFQHYKERNAKFIYGRISSKNMAVMNLYASFGAQFSEPCDIYIRK